ncbi:MAG: hypothetical protein IJJ33_08655 [Victivallales bacterium]|nr:hypothetical protein [Victivallales bacterium]
MATGKTVTVKCQGCENECEVSVAIQADEPVCLGGNNCPTGESFALAQCRKMVERAYSVREATSVREA